VINGIVFDFLFSCHITSDGVYYVAARREIGRNLGYSLVFVRGHFQEIGIAQRFLWGAEATSDVGESELTE